MIAQLVLMPVIGFVFILHGDKPQPRAGVTLTSTQPAAPAIVYAPCPGERIRRVVVSRAATQDTPQTVLWSAKGEAAGSAPLIIGTTPPGMTVTQQLARPISPAADLILVVATTRIPDPAQLRVSMRDLAAGKVLSFDATYDVAAFPAAAMETTPCGAEKDKLEALLAKVLVAEALLSVVGIAVLNLPHYRGPSSPYA